MILMMVLAKLVEKMILMMVLAKLVEKMILAERRVRLLVSIKIRRTNIADLQAVVIPPH
jgi:hypothetical protein